MRAYRIISSLIKAGSENKNELCHLYKATVSCPEKISRRPLGRTKKEGAWNLDAGGLKKKVTFFKVPERGSIF